MADQTPLVEKHNIPVSVSLKRAKMCCIQCSCCTQMCPRYLTGHPLKPHMIMRKLAYAQSPQDVLEDEHVKQTMICSECGLCETYACPMGLQPRQVNIHIKNLLRQNQFRYQKPSGTFTQLEERSFRKAPSKRMAVRLGVDQYYDYHIDRCVTAEPDTVRISLRQHIGAPSVPMVQPGGRVERGQLIGAIPDQALGILEFFSVTGAVIAADAAAKAANVSLIEIRLGTGIGGKSFVTFTGDVGAVEESAEAGAKTAENSGALVAKVVIAHPDRELYRSLL